MNVPEPQSRPIACAPQGLADAERSQHFQFGHELLTARARSRQALEDGYSFVFDAEALIDVARFIASERKCCPFLAFELKVTSTDGPLTLRLTGPRGTRDVLEAELGLKSGCGCK